MRKSYKAPVLELYGSVTALTSSLKCSPGADAGLHLPGTGGHGDAVVDAGLHILQNIADDESCREITAADLVP